MPLAPSHLLAERPAGSSDVVLTWLRRSRTDTDNWALADAPLDVVPEGYRVTILDGVTPVRTLDSSSAFATYTTAEQTADFGSLPSAFAFTVAQLSPVWGPGHAATGAFAG